MHLSGRVYYKLLLPHQASIQGFPETPTFKHGHQLDLIPVRLAAIKNVLHTRCYRSADCDTDHSLVCCNIRMQPKKFHRTKTKGNPRIDVSRMSQPDTMEQFAQTFEKECWRLATAAITGNIRGIYDGIKKALGPTLNNTAPLRSSTGEVITDKGHQLERWAEHYSDLYSRKNIVSTSALDAVECLPTIEELDTEPTLEEFGKAIDSLASGKAPCQQRRSLPDPPKDWLPTKIADHDQILPHKHERDSAVQRQLLQAI